MRRRLFNLAAAVSLAFFAACVILWPLSYFSGLAVTRSTGTDRKVLFRTAEVRSSSGMVQIAWTPRETLERLGGNEDWWRLHWDRPGFDLGLVRGTIPGPLGVAWNRDGPLDRVVLVSWWLVTALSGLLPAARTAARALRPRVHGRDRCRGCGYDLRATPERCPECGAVPGTAQPAA